MSKTKYGSMGLILLVLMLVLAACGGAEADPTATPTQAPATEPAAPAEEGLSEALPEGEALPGICEVVPMPEVPVSPVTEDDYVKGVSPAAAEVTVIEYSDFECPGCAAMGPVLSEFLEANPNVRLVYRHFPLSFHEKAVLTAEAAEAAGAQGSFWEMHDLLFERTAEWRALSLAEAEVKMVEYAEELGLDAERFEEELVQDVYVPKIEAQLQEAMTLGLPGTPSFIVNGIVYPTDQLGLSYAGLESFLDLIELREEQYADAPPMVIDAEQSYEATFNTSAGEIVVELFAAQAPTHVNSFVFLAGEGWYDNSSFFFVEDNFAALAGDPSDTGVGYPGYYCMGEDQGLFDEAGLMGMLPNGQFFFTLGTEASNLSYQFPLVGRIIEGRAVLDDLARRVPGMPGAQELDTVESVTIREQ